MYSQNAMKKKNKWQLGKNAVTKVFWVVAMVITSQTFKAMEISDRFSLGMEFLCNKDIIGQQ